MALRQKLATMGRNAKGCNAKPSAKAHGDGRAAAGEEEAETASPSASPSVPVTNRSKRILNHCVPSTIAESISANGIPDRIVNIRSVAFCRARTAGAARAS